MATSSAVPDVPPSEATMVRQKGRIPFMAKMGRGPGCFTQIEMMVAMAAMVPSLTDPRLAGMGKPIAVGLGFVAMAGCFWVAVQFSWHVLRRLFYNAEGDAIPHSPSAGAWFGGLSVLALGLMAVPSLAFGQLMVAEVVRIFSR